MAQKGGECADATEYKAVFVDTNLDTRLAIPVSSLDTISDIKRKLLIEHSKCFKEFGQIEVHALKVKRKRKLYFLSDIMPVTSVFTGILKGWFLSADISGQFCQNEAVEYNTMLLTDPNTRILIAGPSSTSQLQRGLKNEGIFQADEQSGEARSENLQLVVGFKCDENLKGSSSDTDKRLNTLVEDIYKANCGKDINSSGLVIEVTSVNPVNRSLDVGSLEENKIKKKRKVAAHVNLSNGNDAAAHVNLSNGNDAVEIASKDKDCAGRNLELMNLNAADSKQCDHVVTGEGSADQNNIEDKSSFETNHFKSSLVELRNGSGADIEQSVCPRSEGKKGIESHGRDLKDVSMGSDKTKGTAKKKSKRMTRIKVMNHDRFTGSDASASVSVKSLATPLGANMKGNDISEVHQITYPDKATVSEKGQAKSVSLHVQGNNSTVIPFNMDEAVTEEVGRISVPDAKRKEKEVAINGSSLESGMKRSKKRKNSGGDVSHQMDINRKELGVPDNGETENGTNMLAESGITRPLKRSKTGNDMPDANKMDRVGDEKSGVLTCKQQNQTPKPRKKIKQKQTPALNKVSEYGIEHQNDTMEPEKNKATLLNSAAGKDDNIEILSSPEKNKVPTVLTFGADTEMDTKLGLDDILIPNIERDVKPQQEADETIRSDAEMQITQIEESVDGAEDMNKRSRKKLNISQFPVKDKEPNIKYERSKPAFLKLTAANNDDREFPSSFQEQVDKSGLVANYSVDNEMKKAEVGVDDKVLVSNHWSEICSPKEADETIQYSAESEQLTSIQKRERDNRSKTEKSMKKNKQKSQLLKSMSEFPVDRNNCVRLEGSKSTMSRSEVEKVENDSLSSAAEKIDNICLISASQADDEISTKVQQVIMTNLGRDVNLQQEADNTSQNDVEPMQLTQVQEGRPDTVKNSDQTKKKTKQQKTCVGKNLPKVVKRDQDDSKNGISVDEDLRAYPAEASSIAAKNKAHIMKSKVENSSLKTKDSGSLLNGTASRRVGNTNDSRTSSSHSDLKIKKSHQHKSMKELQKMKQPQSGLHELSDTSTKKVVQNPSKKNSLISKRSSIFKDESSSSYEDKSGGDDSNSSTEPSSSDYSEGESRGSWASPKQGNSKNGGSASNSKSMQKNLTMESVLRSFHYLCRSIEKNLTMESVLRSSHKYKKAKLVASQSQLEEDESQAVDSQGSK